MFRRGAVMSDDSKSHYDLAWIQIWLDLGQVQVAYNAFRNAWRSTYSPQESYATREFVDGILEDLLRVDEEPGVIEEETEEKMRQGYSYQSKDKVGVVTKQFFHLSDESGTNHEVDRRHPGTTPEYDNEDGGFKHLNTLFSPITTVGGQFISSITFAAPITDENSSNRCDFYPTYPMQLLVRTDDHRRHLYYDCFEYKPTWWKSDTGSLPTKKEQKKGMVAMGLLSDCESEEDDDLPIEIKEAVDSEDFQDRKLTQKLLAVAGDFMYSRIFRMQVPISEICGVRVHSPRMRYVNEDGGVADDSEEEQSVLILELQNPASSFAVRCVLSSQDSDNNFAVIEDWTPGKVASRATRHYICGRTEEVNNIASHLAAISEPSQPEEKLSKRRRSARLSSKVPKPNSLDIADLDVDSAPKAGESSNADVHRAESRISEDQVHDILRETCGVTDVNSVSRCLKRAINRGFITLKNGLDTVVLTDQCLDCSEIVTCTVKDILYQKDYAGIDYENGGYDASLRCPTNKCEKHEETWCNEKECRDYILQCPGMYLTGMCVGKAQFDNGKCHNHCDECEGFGICIGDYRDSCHICGGRAKRGKRVKDQAFPEESAWDGWVHGYGEADWNADRKKSLERDPDDRENFSNEDAESCGD